MLFILLTCWFLSLLYRVNDFTLNFSPDTPHWLALESWFSCSMNTAIISSRSHLSYPTLNTRVMKFCLYTAIHIWLLRNSFAVNLHQWYALQKSDRSVTQVISYEFGPQFEAFKIYEGAEYLKYVRGETLLCMQYTTKVLWYTGFIL